MRTVGVNPNLDIYFFGPGVDYTSFKQLLICWQIDHFISKELKPLIFLMVLVKLLKPLFLDVSTFYAGKKLKEEKGNNL